MSSEWKTPRAVLAAAVAVSVGLHLALFAALAKERPAEPADEVVELELFEPPPPPPPPPPPEPEPEPEPAPEPPPKPRPAPKIAKVEPPPPANEPPPPPNEPPPPEAKPAPIKIGVSLSSTTEGGGFAVGVGNSLYGKTDRRAADPDEVKPYAATETKKAPFVPSSRVSTQPKVIGTVKGVYTAEARKAGIEGQVVLRVRIDENGKVVSARVIRGVGHGLDENAVRVLKKARFEPATVDGTPVETEISYTFTYWLE